MIKERYQKWLESGYISNRDRIELKKMTKTSDIEACFGGELTLGTGGMRGIMGLGPNRMNRYVVGKVIQALMLSLKKERPLVIIAYDTRNKAESFAREAARIVLGNGGQVELFDDARPISELSFAIRNRKADFGIMITAGHHPKEYNGIKLYGSDGVQLVPQKICPIIQALDGIGDFSMIKRDPIDRLCMHPSFSYLGEEMDEAYLNDCLKQSRRKEIDCTIKVVYTPLHGTGNRLVRRLLSRRGFTNIWTLTAQEKPDGDFPTVSMPDPAAPESLEAAIKYAKEAGSDLVIATDPVCGRIGLVVMDGREAVPLTGNEVGVLLLNYLINQTKEIPAGSRVVKTAATSDLTRKIAERNGLICEETMMGFRYIGEKAEEYSRLSNHAFFFGYDENCGYATGMEGRVRDGVLAAMLLVEMASFYRCHGISLHSHLKAIYQDFGIYREAMDVFSLDQTGKLEADEIMEAMRLDPPFEGKVIQMIDYLHADTDLPRDNMIKWYLDHAWLAMRPSGDGEKLKCYYSVWAEEEDKAEEGLSLLQDQVRDHMRKAFDK